MFQKFQSLCWDIWNKIQSPPPHFMQNHDGDRAQKMEKQCNRELLSISAREEQENCIPFVQRLKLEQFCSPFFKQLSFEKKILQITNFTFFHNFSKLLLVWKWKFDARTWYLSSKTHWEIADRKRRNRDSPFFSSFNFPQIKFFNQK